MKTPQIPFSWMPYQIANVECPEVPQRTGFIGRVAAMRINGVECFVLCKNDDDLSMVGNTLTHEDYDPALIYKATLIQSTGIEVVIPETPVIESAQDAMQERDQSERDGLILTGDALVPTGDAVRAEDGVPVARYVAEVTHGAETAVEDPDEL